MLTFNPARQVPTAQTAGVLVDLLISPAQAMHMAGDLNGAEAAYRALREAYPEHPKPKHELGVLLAQTDRVWEGVELLIQSVSQKPFEADWHFDLGRALVDCHQALDMPLRPLEKHFLRAIYLDPAHVNSFCMLAQIAEVEGDHDAAIDFYQHCRVLAPQNDRWSFELSKRLEQAGRTEEAVQVCADWLREHGHSAGLEHHMHALTGKDAPARASDEYVTQVFNNYADKFDDHLSRLGYEAPRWVGEALVRRIGPDARGLSVLDAGCGTGLCAPHVRPLAERLVGVDLSPKMLDRARLRGQYDELEAVELVTHAQAHPDEFDAIVCADTLCYFGELADALTAFHAALRPGGTLVFTVEQPQADGTTYALRPNGRYQHPRTYLDNVLRRTGWQGIDMKSVHLRNERDRSVTGWLVCASK